MTSRHLLTLPVDAIGQITQNKAGDEVLIDLVFTDEQLRRAQIHPGAGVDRPATGNVPRGTPPVPAEAP